MQLLMPEADQELIRANAILVQRLTSVVKLEAPL